jgi:hypothetical protein
MFLLLIILVEQLFFGEIQVFKNKHGSATKWFLIETEEAKNSRGLGKGHLKTFSLLPNTIYISVEPTIIHGVLAHKQNKILVENKFQGTPLLPQVVIFEKNKCASKCLKWLEV